MKRKIIKYTKFLVSMVLILGLVAPSYASLSASDGSAFVTKSEFDSALADFNSRLTTFEAGINSKIDSQVTSYLDRNGIWNGKAQILSNGDKVIDIFNTSELPEKTFKALFCAQNNSKHVKSNLSEKDLTVCDKSGMFCFSLVGQGEFNVQVYGSIPSGSFYKWNIDDNYVTVELVSAGEEGHVVKYCSIISDTELSFDSSTSARKMMNIRPINQQGFFFVSKGDFLSTVVAFSSYNLITNAYTEYSGAKKYDFNLSISDCVIY